MYSKVILRASNRVIFICGCLQIVKSRLEVTNLRVQQVREYIVIYSITQLALANTFDRQKASFGFNSFYI